MRALSFMEGQMAEMLIEMAEGRGRVDLFRPEGAVRGGVVLYMDAFGPRPALAGMAERMAGMGLAVAVPDLFYRFGAYGPYDAATAFQNEPTAGEIRRMVGATTQEMTVADSGAVIDLLVAEGAAKIATVGYCMGGARALNVAAATAPAVLAASFHGGNLASEAADSPHLRLKGYGGRVYVASAGVDRSFPPEQSARLALALREGGVDHVIENYPDCAHGWCVPDHSVYHPAGAERHWKRLEWLFGEAFA